MQSLAAARLGAGSPGALAAGDEDARFIRDKDAPGKRRENMRAKYRSLWVAGAALALGAAVAVSPLQAHHKDGHGGDGEPTPPNCLAIFGASNCDCSFKITETPQGNTTLDLQGSCSTAEILVIPFRHDLRGGGHTLTAEAVTDPTAYEVTDPLNRCQSAVITNSTWFDPDGVITGPRGAVVDLVIKNKTTDLDAAICFDGGFDPPATDLGGEYGTLLRAERNVIEQDGGGMFSDAVIAIQHTGPTRVALIRQNDIGKDLCDPGGSVIRMTDVAGGAEIARNEVDADHCAAAISVDSMHLNKIWRNTIFGGVVGISVTSAIEGSVTSNTLTGNGGPEDGVCVDSQYVEVKRNNGYDYPSCP